MNNIGDFLENEIYPRLDRALVFAALNPVEKGNKYTVACPECGKREAYIFKDKWRLHCGRENACGATIGILQYIAGTPEPPRGQAFVDAARTLAKMAGVAWEERQKTAEQLEVIAVAQEREHQLEQLLRLCTLDDNGKLYLTSRGFTQASYPAEFGTCGTAATSFLRSNPTLLLQRTTEDAATIDRAISNWFGRIVAPVRDRKGRLRGVFGRDTTGHAESKYLYTSNLPFDKIGLIGLDIALSNNNRDITVWEGVWDVFSLRAQGYWQGCGIGGSLSKFSPDVWMLLSDFGIRSVTLFTDNDDAGRKGLLTALDNADKAPRAPEVFVIDPAQLGQSKDPDEYVRTNGIDAFRTLLDTAIHAYKYRSIQFADGLDLTRQKQHNEYLQKCIDYDARFTDKRRIQKLTEYFWTDATTRADADLDAILDVRDDMRATAIRNEESAVLAGLTREIQGKQAEGDIEAAKDLLYSGIDRIKLIKTKPNVEPLLTVAEEIDLHYDRWEQNLNGKYIGLESGQRILDDTLLGIRGFGIFGARSNVGKTTQLCGLAIGTLIAHPEACVAFYSLEMPRSDIIDKLACYLTRTDWRGLRKDKSLTESRELARRELHRLGRRLLILDRANNPSVDGDKMLRQIAALKDRSECSRVLVLVDYLDVIDLDEEKDKKFGNNDRMIEKEQIKIVQMISEVIGKENPVIAVTEVRKGDEKEPITIEDLSGTTRKGYAADWVLTMNPMSDRELAENFEYVEYVGVSDPPAIKYRGARHEFDDEKELKKVLKTAPKIRRILSAQGLAVGYFSTVKARDGGKRHDWEYTNYFNQSRIEEGITYGMAGA